MSLIENSSNILQLLYQEITISNYSSSIHLWQEEQELELQQSRNAIKIPQKLFESKSRGSSEKKRRNQKASKCHRHTSVSTKLSDPSNTSTTGAANFLRAPCMTISTWGKEHLVGHHLRQLVLLTIRLQLYSRHFRLHKQPANPPRNVIK